MTPNFFDLNNEPLSRRLAQGIGRLATALRQNAWQEALPEGLTPTQGEIVIVLEQRPGATLSQVADTLGVRPATASEAVRVLVEKGLVTKGRSPGDGRALWLQLSPEGRRVAEQASRWDDFLAQAIERLESEEQRTTLRVVSHLIRTLQEEGRVPTARLCVTCRHFRPHRHDDPQRPHHCALVDAAFGDGDLRVDCPEHEPAAIA